MPSANAALHGGYERECEQGMHVTSWHKYKSSLNPFLSFVMTTDSARCSSLLCGFPMEAGVFSSHARTHACTQTHIIKQHLRPRVKQYDSTFRVIFLPHYVMWLFFIPPGALPQTH